MSGIGFSLNGIATGQSLISLGLGGSFQDGSPPAAMLPGTVQGFSTISLPNANLALYALSIRDFKPPYAAQYGYIFPLSPSSINKEFSALTATYDTQGGIQSLAGVARTVDVYGDTLPTFVIEGTTGWQYHQTDGYSFTGQQSIIAVQSLINTFASLNRGQQLAQAPLYPLEYYDYFTGEFWQVVPSGPQIVRQNALRPLLYDYAFRLVAVGLPVGGSSDSGAFFQSLGQSGNANGGEAIAELNQGVGGTLDQYGAFTSGVG